MMTISSITSSLKSFIIALLKIIFSYAEAFYRLFIPPPMVSIDGETILVTGAGGGIGREICKNLVKSGKNIKLVLWDLDLLALEKLAAELHEIGDGLDHKIYLSAFDISKRESIEECCKKVKDEVGSISVIFNNAGIAKMGNILSFTTDELEKIIQVNLMSHFWIIRHFLPDMIFKNYGRIINVASIAGLKAGPLAVPYVASKFAVNGYTDALKMELQFHNCDGIRVTTVYPFFTNTPINTTLKLNAGMPPPFHKFHEPEDVGRKIVDGMRRQYEYIYFPTVTPIALVLLDFFATSKARHLLQGKSYKSFVHNDEAEHRRVRMPYQETIQSIKVGKERNVG